MIESRVPLRSERSETNPYASNGATAATASSSANRVAMWRIRIAIRSHLISAGGQLLGCGPPEVKRRDHICASFGWHIKAPTDGSGSFSPREKDGWRVFDDC